MIQGERKAPEASHRRMGQPRMWIVCTGAGRVQRGFETYARDLFAALREDGELDVMLLQGGGSSAAGERTIPSLHRDGAVNAAICRVVGHHRRYTVEYASFCAAMLPALVTSPPDVIYALEFPVYKFLRLLRRRLRARWRLVHFTGGQLARLVPADAGTFLHHVTPCTVGVPQAAGFAPDHQFVLPHFVDLRRIPQPIDANERAAVRTALGLPVDRPVVLSVGSLDIRAKRMDYLVREIGALPLRSRPYLVMLGHHDHETPQLEGLAESLLGSDGYTMGTVSRHDLWSYYAAADVFALASMAEGFGLVYVEALASGVPVVAHDFAVSRFVLADHGTFADLSHPGALGRALGTVTNGNRESPEARRAYVRERFDWSVLGAEYRRVFRDIANA